MVTIMTLTPDQAIPDDVMMAGDRPNPWVEVDGVPVDWEASSLPRIECPCEDHGPVIVAGVLEAMDQPEGIQRCDACSTFDSDLEAAQALARLVGGVVRFYRS